MNDKLNLRVINGIFIGILFTLFVSFCTAKIFELNEKSCSFFKLFLICIIVYSNFFVQEQIRPVLYYIFPLATLLFVSGHGKVDKRYRKIYLLIWLFFGVVTSLFLVGILILPLTIDLNRTVFSDHSIQSFAEIHFGQTGSITTRLKFLFFEIFLYLFSMFRRLFDYLTFWNISALFGFGSFLAFLIGVKEMVARKDKWLAVSFVSSFLVVVFILMVGRSIDEKCLWMMFSPIVAYMALFGHKKISLPVLFVLQIGWLVFTKPYV